MKPETVYSVVFSPTGTSNKIAATIAHAVSHNAAQSAPYIAQKTIDLTHAAAQSTTLPRNAVAIVVIPVYGGHPAPTAIKRMKELQGEGTPTVVVAVYGNRDIGDAASQLARFLTTRGFIPIAAAAFVGEHSYSTPAHPIAAGRPDDKDLAVAAAFGASIGNKLTDDRLAPIDVTALKAPHTPLLTRLRFGWFVLGYLRRQKQQPAPIPEGDMYRCTHCGRCVTNCPTEAIIRGDEVHTDRTRCIRCNACIKVCPAHARNFRSPFGKVLSRFFSTRKEPVTIL